MIIPVSQAYAGEISPVGKEGRTLGVLNIAFYSGLGLGPILGGVIKDYFGIRMSFVSMGLVCLVGFILCLLILPSRKSEKKILNNEKPENFAILIREPVILGLFLNRFAYILCVGILWTFMPLLAAQDYGFSSSMIGILISMLVLITAILTPLTSLLADRTHKRGLMFIGGILIFFSMLMFAVLDSVSMIILATILSGLAGALVTSSTTAMGIILGRQLHSMGSVMSLQMQGHSIGMCIGPLLAGIIMDFFDINAAFAGAGVVMLAFSFVSLILTKDFDVGVQT